MKGLFPEQAALTCERCTAGLSVPCIPGIAPGERKGCHSSPRQCAEFLLRDINALKCFWGMDKCHCGLVYKTENHQIPKSSAT